MVGGAARIGIFRLLKDKVPKTLFSSDGLLGEIKKAFAERLLNAEMDHHLSDSTQDEVSEGEKAARATFGTTAATNALLGPQ